MVFSAADSLSKTEQELSRIKRGRFRLLRTLGVAAAVLAAVIFGIRFLNRYEGTPQSIAEARHALLASGLEWSQLFSDSQEWDRTWFARHGISIEISLFDKLSEGLFRSAETFIARLSSTEHLSFTSRLYLGMLGGTLRVGFLILACFRLWLVAIGLAIFYGLRSLRVHSKRDILGQAGNGRLFFSGVRVGLENATPEGAPADQITGLACPATVSLSHAKASAIVKLLESFGAVTMTNIKLAGIIEFHKNNPAFVAMPDDEAALQNYFAGATLSENTLAMLKGALILHRVYRGEGDMSDLEAVDAAQVEHEVQQGKKVSAATHAAIATRALDRVLTNHLRESLALLDAATIATIILSLEAGKSMAHSFEGGKWIRKSNFPQLCARSVLHSIPEFALEYDFDLRTTIRRALIFGSRSSMFAPVKFPIEFRDESRAARQWVEILMATPVDLPNVADEVQLLGLLGELHAGWERVFFDGAIALDPEVIDQVYATPQNLILMPIQRVLRLMRRTMDRPTIQGLEVLISVVSQRQRLKLRARANAEGDDDHTLVPAYEKIFPPFTPDQQRALIDLHGLSADDVRDWSSLRLVLSSYGWLARRVGERTVPESSIVYSVFAADENFPGVNDRGLAGFSGVVPVRATRLAERWGKAWGARFTEIGSARMAENHKDFEALLAGAAEEVETDPAGQTVAQGSNG